MKKTNYLFMTLVMSVLLISCGGKNDKKDGSSTEITSSESDVPLDQLKSENCVSNLKDFYTTGINSESFFMDIKRKGDKENFTGVGVEKDQNDSILNRAELKNGWLIRYTHRIKKDNRYITISDLTYDSGKIKDGFLFETNNKSGSDKGIIEGFDCIIGSKKYKNGKENVEWTIAIYPKDNICLNAVWDDEGGRIISSDEVMALHLNYSKTLKLKQSISGFKQIIGNDYSNITGKVSSEWNDFYYVNANQQIVSNTLKNLKNEVKGFDYWEE